jgi:hypothetical protein
VVPPFFQATCQCSTLTVENLLPTYSSYPCPLLPLVYLLALLRTNSLLGGACLPILLSSHCCHLAEWQVPGGDAVSEGQAYGILASAIAIAVASMNEGDMHYDDAKTQFSGYFNGWRKMLENSMASCQNPKFCNG